MMASSTMPLTISVTGAGPWSAPARAGRTRGDLRAGCSRVVVGHGRLFANHARLASLACLPFLAPRRYVSRACRAGRACGARWRTGRSCRRHSRRPARPAVSFSPPDGAPFVRHHVWLRKKSWNISARMRRARLRVRLTRQCRVHPLVEEARNARDPGSSAARRRPAPPAGAHVVTDPTLPPARRAVSAIRSSIIPDHPAHRLQPRHLALRSGILAGRMRSGRSAARLPARRAEQAGLHAVIHIVVVVGDVVG